MADDVFLVFDDILLIFIDETFMFDVLYWRWCQGRRMGAKVWGLPGSLILNSKDRKSAVETKRPFPGKNWKE